MLTFSDVSLPQWLVSAVQLGLTGTRLHYTLFLPPNDPLNNGQPFYDPIAAELLVTSVVALFWSSYMCVIEALETCRAPRLGGSWGPPCVLG